MLSFQDTDRERWSEAVGEQGRRGRREEEDEGKGWDPGLGERI